MKTTLTDQEKAIVDTLQTSSSNATHIARWLGVPCASVRRNIQSLRRKGYGIVATLPNSLHSRYRLVSEPATTSTETTDAAV